MTKGTEERGNRSTDHRPGDGCRAGAGLTGRRGSVTVMMALSTAVLLGLLALGIDLGALFNARAEAQRAADAAALAGASAFLDYRPEEVESHAVQRAVETGTQNVVRNQPVAPQDVSVRVNTDSMTVQASIRRDRIPTWFASVLGIDAVDVSAQATAWAAMAGAAQCLKPFAIPDAWQESSQDTNGNQIWDDGERWSYDPEQGDRYVPYSGSEDDAATGYGSDWRDGRPDLSGRSYDRDYGRRIKIKVTDPKQTFVSSFFFPWVLPQDADQQECGADPADGGGGGKGGRGGHKGGKVGNGKGGGNGGGNGGGGGNGNGGGGGSGNNGGNGNGHGRGNSVALRALGGSGPGNGNGLGAGPGNGNGPGNGGGNGNGSGNGGGPGNGNGGGPGNGKGGGPGNGKGGGPGNGKGNGKGPKVTKDDGSGRGAARYRQNICSCNSSVIDLDTEYMIEPGNMVGPTYQGIQQLIAQDPDARWDDASNTVVSQYGMDSPRIVTIALFDPSEIDKPGRQYIRFNNFARVFIEDQASPQDPVTGRFLYYVSGLRAGRLRGETTGSLVRTLQLIR